jgi:hypothetical protein
MPDESPFVQILEELRPPQKAAATKAETSPIALKSN